MVAFAHGANLLGDGWASGLKAVPAVQAAPVVHTPLAAATLPPAGTLGATVINALPSVALGALAVLVVFKGARMALGLDR